MANKKGQVWVETVIYTLIGLALIGVVLAIAIPKINAARDKIIVEQTIGSLNAFDEKINEILNRGPGNIRNIEEFSIKRGELFINSSGDEISFVLEDLSEPYSQPGAEIERNNVKIISEENKGRISVKLRLNYGNFINLTYAGGEEPQKFTAASIPYKFSIENRGDINNNSIFVLDIRETSSGAISSPVQGGNGGSDNPPPEVDCSPYQNNGDGTCNATLGASEIIEDGYMLSDSSGSSFSRFSSSSDILIGPVIDPSFNFGYVEWDISLIPQSSQVVNLSLRYSGITGSQRETETLRLISLPSSVSTSSDADLGFAAVTGTLIHNGNGFVIGGVNEFQPKFNLDETIGVNSLQSEIQSGSGRFAVAMFSEGPFRTSTSISSSDGGFAPTLTITYIP